MNHAGVDGDAGARDGLKRHLIACDFDENKFGTGTSLSEQNFEDVEALPRSTGAGNLRALFSGTCFAILSWKYPPIAIWELLYYLAPNLLFRFQSESSLPRIPF